MRGFNSLEPLPGEPGAVEHARPEILDDHVAALDQRLDHGLLPFGVFMLIVMLRLFEFSIVK